MPRPIGFWYRSTPLKVLDSGLHPQPSLTLVHSLSSYSPVAVSVEIADSGSVCWLSPVPPVSWDWFGSRNWICPWLLLPVELICSLSQVAGSFLLLFRWRSLTPGHVARSILICRCPRTGTGFAPGFCSFWRLFPQTLPVLGLKHIPIMYLFPFLTSLP